jgi:transglutaminase-like putative cysteine protease
MMTFALALAVGASVGALSPLFTVSTWWVGAEAVVILVLVAVTAARALVPWQFLVPFVAPVFGAVVLLLVVNAAYAGDQSVFGVIPTVESLTQLTLIADTASIDIGSSRVPMIPAPPISFVLMAGAGLLAIVVEVIAVAWRKPALTGIPLGTLVVIPSFFGASVDQWFYIVVAAAAYLLVLYVGIGEARPSGAVGVGASGILAAMLLPLVLPGVNPADRPEFTGNGFVAVNNFIDLSANLNLKDPVDVLTYRSLTGDPEYLRLGSIVNFSGTEWTMDDALSHAGATVATIGRAPGLAQSTETVDRTTSISINSLAGARVPVPYSPRSITGLSDAWGWDDRDLTISSRAERAQGAAYVVQSVLAVPSAAQLNALGSGDLTQLTDYLQVPADVPESVLSTAATVTAKASTNFEKAIALQSYFTDGAFTYSETAPVAQGYDGSGGAVIGRFLEAKEGYCVHFASAMAVMARSLGIPARIALGFVPGTYIEPDDTQQPPYYLVTSRDLHTWPELYFDKVGWVRFEPTPGKGELPDFSDNSPLPTDGGPTPEPIDTPRPIPTGTDSPTDSPTFDPSFEPDNGSSNGDLIQRVTVAVLALALLAVLIVPLLPAIRRLVRRLLRYRRVYSRGDALAAWLEIHDTALDAGVIYDGYGTGPDGAKTTTPRELTELLSPLLDDREPIERLLAAIETDAFSRDAGTAELADVRDVRRSVTRALTVRERLVAVFTPASMRSVVSRFSGGSER